MHVKFDFHFSLWYAIPHCSCVARSFSCYYSIFVASVVIDESVAQLVSMARFFYNFLYTKV